MNQGLALSRRLCARNAGFGLIVRLLLSIFVFFSLNILLEVPGETTLIAVKSVKPNFLIFLFIIIAILIMTKFVGQKKLLFRVTTG